jgi:hypothetical protein
MIQVEFEPTIPVFERAKTVHALDCAATVIGTFVVEAGKYCAYFYCVPKMFLRVLQQQIMA